MTLLLGVLPALGASAQGTFQNLTFESAVVPDLPPNQAALIPFTNALPGWSGYVDDTNQALVAAYNGISVGAHAICLIDLHTAPYSNSVISGHFTAVIQAGNANPPLQYGSAVLAQTGLIPPNSRSLLFDASYFGGDITNFFVTINGQNMAYTAVGSGANFTEYGVNISAFAGQTVELRFTSQPGSYNPFTTVFLDNIQFSDTVIPEPGAFALVIAGIFFLSRCGPQAKVLK